ncbi:polyphosphate kinase 2 family protein [bacterium]|nr:polyphosphate kinase 2 family protein [bacterium]
MDIGKLSRQLLVKPGKKPRLSKIRPDWTCGLKDKEEALKAIAKNQEKMAGLQHLLYAENKHALLVVFQGMDACGKDGTVRTVMRGVNPQGCRVHSFKAPTAQELDHDFLWRVHQVVPPRGEIGIFNRSHYEDVLVVRVHDIVPEAVWSKRYKQINDFERTLARNGTTILKFFLHISKDEQKQRLQERLDDPAKSWKMNPADLKERDLWKKYMDAYQDALAQCSTPWAPWYVVPADRNWFRNLAVSQIIVETLQSLRMKFPKPDFDPKKIIIK